jgi:penicillin-binding protein 1C
MQVARLLEPRADRTFVAKLRQAVRAVQLERTLSKDDILSLYLSLAPYGGNLEGVRAASHAYFGKEPKKLLLGEAALLVAIPQSPRARRPDVWPKSPSAPAIACSTVVSQAGRIPGGRDRPCESRDRAWRAPADADVRAACRRSGDRNLAGPQGRRADIDANIQKPLEELRASAPVRSARTSRRDRRRRQCHRPSARARRRRRLLSTSAGPAKVDMTQALRSPGSTLKPFIYGLAFEDWAGSPRDADRGSPDPLRLLRAGGIST